MWLQVTNAGAVSIPSGPLSVPGSLSVTAGGVAVSSGGVTIATSLVVNAGSLSLTTGDVEVNVGTLSVLQGVTAGATPLHVETTSAAYTGNLISIKSAAANALTIGVDASFPFQVCKPWVMAGCSVLR